MLREERKVRQIPGDLKRRWFTGRLFDLIVWYTPKGMICGFQLCYREGTDEKALTWRQEHGYSHNRIDNGESRPGRYKMTPILVPDGRVDRARLMSLFQRESEQIDPEIAEFVLKMIAEFPE